MEVAEKQLSEIRPYFKNAKVHKDKQVKKLADSIKEFGFNQPIVVDKEGVIIVGHGRYLAAQSLGLDEVPVIVLDVPEEKAKAYRLADNKLNESKWEMELVIEELKTLSLDMVDLTGFDANLLLETQEDDPPDLSSVGVPKTKAGDVYELGRHKLICGDSTAPETYQKLLKDEKARMIFTDPPYSIDYVAGNINSPSEKYERGGRIMGDARTPAEALEFYKKVLFQFQTFTTDDATLYWWFATRLTDVNMAAFRESGWHYSQIVLWLKNSLIFSPSQLFHRIYEPCMIGWKEGKSPYQNHTFTQFTELWTTGGLKTFAEHLDVWYQKRDNTSKYIHPTQKPVQLAERAIKRSSEENDIVLDAFGGSGSSLIACEQLKRSSRMIELDPKYCDVIVSRWLKYTDDTHVVKNGEKILW